MPRPVSWIEVPEILKRPCKHGLSWQATNRLLVAIAECTTADQVAAILLAADRIANVSPMITAEHIHQAVAELAT